MAAPANPGDEVALASCAEDLADRIEAALPGWVHRCVARVMTRWLGEVPPDVEAEAVSAGQRAAAATARSVRALLSADVDEQATGPLSLIRDAVRWPTGVLAAAGAPPVKRDEFAARAFPEDVYDLSPASFADVDPALEEPGIVWGAAKAYVVLARRRAGAGSDAGVAASAEGKRR